jgi:type VI secretion system secreted protein Hcp
MPDILLDVGDTSAFKGESLIEGFEDLIVCESFSFGATQPLDLGRGTNRTAGTMSISEIQLSRQHDLSSTPLLHAMFSGKVFEKVKINFLKAASNSDQANDLFLVVELSEAIFSSVSYSGASGGSVMSESISIGFVAIEFDYKVQKPEDGTLEGSIKASFNLLTQKSSQG